MKNKAIPEDAFIKLWNESISAIAVAKSAHVSVGGAITRASKLRSKGMDLKRMVQHQDPTRHEIRSDAAKKRCVAIRGDILDRLGADFFQANHDTSWAWMASATGVDDRTLRRCASDAAFSGKIDGARKVRRFQCPDSLRNYIDGLILSDASTTGTLTHSLEQSSVSKDWLHQIQSTLNAHGIQSVVRTTTRKGRKSAYRLRTPTYQTFTDFHVRWYPQGVKIVPRDLDLSSPDLLRNFYLGDGSMGGHVLEFCTEGFTDDDVRWMRDELNRIHGWGVTEKRVKAGLRLLIYARWRNAFFDVIDTDIPPSLRYRFRRSTGHYMK